MSEYDEIIGVLALIGCIVAGMFVTALLAVHMEMKIAKKKGRK